MLNFVFCGIIFLSMVPDYSCVMDSRAEFGYPAGLMSNCKYVESKKYNLERCCLGEWDFDSSTRQLPRCQMS